MYTTCPPHLRKPECTHTPEVCERACQRYNETLSYNSCDNVNLDLFSCDDNNECSAVGVDINGNEIRFPFGNDRMKSLGCPTPPKCADCLGSKAGSESKSKSVAGPVSYSVAESEAKSVAGPVSYSVAEPEAKSVAKSLTSISKNSQSTKSSIYSIDNKDVFGLDLNFSGDLSEEEVNSRLEQIKSYIESENGKVIEVNRYFSNVITEPITTSVPALTIGKSTAAPVIGSSNNLESINKSLDQLTVKDIKILLSALMSVDLDNVKDDSIFSLLSSARNHLMKTNEYDSDQSLGKDLNNYRTTPMPQNVRDYLKRYDPTTYNIFFGKNKGNKHSAFIPGFQYTAPSSWPSQHSKPPLCTVDESQLNEPVPFYSKGAPVNALDYEKLKILPTPEFRFA